MSFTMRLCSLGLFLGQAAGAGVGLAQEKVYAPGCGPANPTCVPKLAPRERAPGALGETSFVQAMYLAYGRTAESKPAPPSLGNHERAEVEFRAVLNSYYMLELGRRVDGSAKVFVQGWKLQTAMGEASGQGRVNLGERAFFAGYAYADRRTGELIVSHATDVLVRPRALDLSPYRPTASAVVRSSVKYRSFDQMNQLSVSIEPGLKGNIAGRNEAQLVLEAFAGWERSLLPAPKWGPTFSLHLGVDLW